MANDFQRLKTLRERLAANADARYAAEARAGLHDRMRANAMRRGDFESIHRQSAMALREKGVCVYQCQNPECAAIFFAKDDEPKACRACESTDLKFAPVRGEFSADAPCNALCTHATGPECLCQCGGANHGANWLVGFTFPRNIDVYRAEMRQRKADRAEITAIYDTAEIDALRAEADRLSEYLETSLWDARETLRERQEALAAELAAAGGPPPVLLTKAKKPSKDQLYDVCLTKAKVRVVEDFTPFARSWGKPSTSPVLELTGVDQSGCKRWFRVNHGKQYDWLWRPCTSPAMGRLGLRSNDGHEIDDYCFESRLEPGDLVRVKAREKDRGDDITFMSHAEIVGAIETLEYV